MVNFDEIGVGDLVVIGSERMISSKRADDPDGVMRSYACETARVIGVHNRNRITNPYIELDIDNGRWLWFPEMIFGKEEITDNFVDIDILYEEG